MISLTGHTVITFFVHLTIINASNTYLMIVYTYTLLHSQFLFMFILHVHIYGSISNIYFFHDCVYIYIYFYLQKLCCSTTGKDLKQPIKRSRLSYDTACVSNPTQIGMLNGSDSYPITDSIIILNLTQIGLLYGYDTYPITGRIATFTTGRIA